MPKRSTSPIFPCGHCYSNSTALNGFSAVTMVYEAIADKIPDGLCTVNVEIEVWSKVKHGIRWHVSFEFEGPRGLVKLIEVDPVRARQSLSKIYKLCPFLRGMKMKVFTGEGNNNLTIIKGNINVEPHNKVCKWPLWMKNYAEKFSEFSSKEVKQYYAALRKRCRNSK